jgi:hypothetical protein
VSVRCHGGCPASGLAVQRWQTGSFTPPSARAPAPRSSLVDSFTTLPTCRQLPTLGTHRATLAAPASRIAQAEGADHLSPPRAATCTSTSPSSLQGQRFSSTSQQLGTESGFTASTSTECRCTPRGGQRFPLGWTRLVGSSRLVTRPTSLRLSTRLASTFRRSTTTAAQATHVDKHQSRVRCSSQSLNLRARVLFSSHACTTNYMQPKFSWPRPLCNRLRFRSHSCVKVISWHLLAMLK